MPTVALFLLVQISAPGPENWAYVTCITSSASEVLKDSPTPEEYAQRLERLCPAERAVLRQSIVRRHIEAGRSRAEANADADEFFAEIRRQMLSLQPGG